MYSCRVEGLGFRVRISKVQNEEIMVAGFSGSSSPDPSLTLLDMGLRPFNQAS